jgi:hypothetical protein
VYEIILPRGPAPVKQEESKETGGFVAHDLARNPSWFSINQTPQTADPKGK